MSQQLLTTPSRHSRSLTSVADDAWSWASGTLLSVAGPPLAKVGERAVVSLLSRIKYGKLVIITPSTTYTFPSDTPASDDEPHAELRVVRDSFWVRLCTMSDLGFSEAFMYGDVECDDLVSMFKVFLYNRESLGGLENGFAIWLFSIPQRLTTYRFLGTISNARSNLSAHYDISNAMFEAFLSKDMMYSSGIFEKLDSDLVSASSSATLASPHGAEPLRGSSRPVSAAEVHSLLLKQPSAHRTGDELYDAQMRKVGHVLQKADVRPGHKVLDIGCGWGTLAITAVKEFGADHVDGITLSVHQQTLARQRIDEEGLSDHIDIHLLDYRSLPEAWKGSFDRVISVEMIEHVGPEFMDAYWKVVDWALKPTSGVAVVQGITIPEARFAAYAREVDFIKKWLTSHQVFPGGCLPTISLLIESINRSSQGKLVVDSVSNIGPHYARTLREWRKRFLAKFDSHIVPALKSEHPDVMLNPEEIEVFKRKWVYYFSYCEVGFATRRLGDHIITMTREGDETYTRTE